jgi:hypothetical protein
MARAAHTKACPTCGQPTTRIERVDAYACLACDVWLEDPCNDPTCEFCAKRPGRPSDIAGAPAKGAP